MVPAAMLLRHGTRPSSTRTDVIEIVEQVLWNSAGTYTTSSRCTPIRMIWIRLLLDVPYCRNVRNWIAGSFPSINKLIKEVTADMDQYDHMKAVRKIHGLRYRRSVQLVYQKSKKKILRGRTGLKTRSRFMQRPMK